MTDVLVVTSADSERDQRGAAATPADLAAWGWERLAAAQRPKSLHPLDDLPRTSTGKVRRLDLPGVLGLDGG